MSLCYEGSNTDWWRWVPFCSKRRNVKEITKSTRLEKKSELALELVLSPLGLITFLMLAALYYDTVDTWGAGGRIFDLESFTSDIMPLRSSSSPVLFTPLVSPIIFLLFNYLFFFLFFPYFLFLFIVYRIFPRLLLSYRCKI